MNGEFKQCPNGHYYQGDHCPYCKTTGNISADTGILPYTGSGSQMDAKVEGEGGAKITIIDGQETVVGTAKGTAARGAPASGTVISDGFEVEVTPSGDRVEKKIYRSTRRLVGWLVSYSFDPIGVDCRLYEGQNTIGRDMNNNITVTDGTMSSKHATLLFRDGLYALKDEMSLHGTFVNDENIGFEPRVLKDGDMIRMGETIFKFRTSF